MAKTPRQIFISAASGDQATAQELASHLQRAGVKTWVSSTAVLPGRNWYSEVGDALAESDVLVVLVSPAAMQSNSVRREITYALGEPRFEDRLIPVLLKRTPRHEIPWPLASLPWLEGTPVHVAELVLRSLKVPARAAAG